MQIFVIELVRRREYTDCTIQYTVQDSYVQYRIVSAYVQVSDDQ